MADLIDRQALLDDIQAAADNGGMGAVVAGTLKRYVKRTTAVDAVEVVHGYWDDSGRYKFPSGAIAVRCSECGCALSESEYHISNWNYCPVCGAKMDGERRGENAAD